MGRQMFHVWKWVAVVLVGLFVLAPAVGLACPNCKFTVEEETAAQAASDNPGDLAAGFYYSILFMMGMTLTLATCLVLFIRREARNATSHGA